MENCRIVSYYTHDTPYVQVIHKYLMSSLKPLKIKSDIVGVQSLGSWQANTSFKPKFILKMLEKHEENIIFVDADARINKTPILFSNIPEEYNFAAYILDRNLHYNKKFQDKYRLELLTGSLFVRNNVRSKEIIGKWVQECTNSKHWEQKILQRVLTELDERVYKLPLSYCYINSLPNGDEPLMKCVDPVITHYQCSRQIKKEMLGKWIK